MHVSHGASGLEQEIEAAYKLVTDNGYLSEPCHQHTSIDGQVLDRDAINLVKLAEKNILSYREALCNGEQPDNISLKPIHMTPGDREKYEDNSSLTCVKLREKIDNIVLLLNDLGDDTSDICQQLRGCKNRKAHLVDIAEQVQDQYDNIVNLLTLDKDET